jgi:type I restriction enzyme R subunit
VKRLLRIDKEMAGEARDDFAVFISAGDVAAYAKDLYGALKKDFTGNMKLLRNPDFQRLLRDYKRKESSFLIAHTVQDQVSSEWLVRGLDGKEYKPEDYLVAFSEFVKTHGSDVDAISVLLKRPQDWKPEVLKSLRDKLAAAPPRFTVQNLQKAYEIRDKKPLADIISMVKHAANDQSPLLNAGERVDAAFVTITQRQLFTKEQQQWLERIRTHLQENLSIDKDDFEDQPTFADYGGWGRATKIFQGRLPNLIKDLNRAIAA